MASRSKEMKTGGFRQTVALNAFCEKVSMMNSWISAKKRKPFLEQSNFFPRLVLFPSLLFVEFSPSDAERLVEVFVCQVTLESAHVHSSRQISSFFQFLNRERSASFPEKLFEIPWFQSVVDFISIPFQEQRLKFFRLRSFVDDSSRSSPIFPVHVSNFECERRDYFFRP